MPAMSAACVRLAVLFVCAWAVAAQDVSSSSTGDDSSNSSSSTAPSGAARNVTTPYQIYPQPPPVTPRTYCDTEDEGAMRVYDNVTICIVVGGAAKIRFYVNVDEFSVMEIVDNRTLATGNNTGVFDNPGLWFQAEYSQMPSPYKYRQPQVDPASDGYGWVVPFWTLLITLKDGVVDSVEWDDGCIGCSDFACVQDTCAIDPVAAGCRDPSSTANCSPRFFVGWTGTDRNGQYLISAGLRYSQYRQWSASSAFSSAYQSVSEPPLKYSNNEFNFTPECTDPNAPCETTPT